MPVYSAQTSSCQMIVSSPGTDQGVMGVSGSTLDLSLI
jgi:hypothetical protein